MITCPLYLTRFVKLFFFVCYKEILGGLYIWSILLVEFNDTFFTTTLLFGSHNNFFCFCMMSIVYEQSSDLGQSSSNFKDRILTFRSSFVNALSFEWKNVVKRKCIRRGEYRRTLYRAWDMTFKNAYTYNGYCCCGFRYSNLSLYDQYWLLFFLWNECLLMDKCCVSWYVSVFEE